MNKTILLVLFSVSLLMVAGCQAQNSTNEQVPEKAVLETQEAPLTEEAQNIEGDLYNIKNISRNDNEISIEIDKIEWLSSSDNTCSIPPEIKAGMPQCNSNGFLIENSISDLKTYKILPSASIQTTAFGANPVGTKISLQEFNEAFASETEYFEFAPFFIKIENDIVVAMQEKYVP